MFLCGVFGDLQALATFGDEIGIAFSGAEDVALVEYAHLTGRPFRVFRCATISRNDSDAFLLGRYACLSRRRSVLPPNPPSGPVYSFYTTGYGYARCE